MTIVVAEFSVTPLVAGTIKPYIDSAISEIDRAGLKKEVGPASTTVEGDLDQVMMAIKNAHQAVLNKGADRVVTEIRIDEKKGGLTMRDELEGYRKLND
ncbi:MAG TPA: MTH1187 family thiamine-binding protein [Armatimonadota bacterium]